MLRLPERAPQGQMPHTVHHCVLKDLMQSTQHSENTCCVKKEGRNELIVTVQEGGGPRGVVVPAEHVLTLTQPDSLETVTKVTYLQHVCLGLRRMPGKRGGFTPWKFCILSR